MNYNFVTLGLTNTVTAIKNAQMAESPLLLMGGAAATLLKVNITNKYVSGDIKYMYMMCMVIIPFKRTLC